MNMEEILRLAKIFYPTGTKYTTAGINSTGFSYIVDNPDNFFFDVVNGSIVLHAEPGKGNLYYKNTWAKIFNGPQVSELELELEKVREIIKD